MPYSYIIFAYYVASAHRGRNLVLGSWGSESGKTYDPIVASSQVIKQEEVTPLTITISKHAPHHITGHLGHIMHIMWQINILRSDRRSVMAICRSTSGRPTEVSARLHISCLAPMRSANIHIQVHVNYTTREAIWHIRNHRNQRTCSQQILLIGVAIIRILTIEGSVALVGCIKRL